jgi:hypothetical protein
VRCQILFGERSSIQKCCFIHHSRCLSR